MDKQSVLTSLFAPFSLLFTFFWFLNSCHLWLFLVHNFTFLFNILNPLDMSQGTFKWRSFMLHNLCWKSHLKWRIPSLGMIKRPGLVFSYFLISLDTFLIDLGCSSCLYFRLLLIVFMFLSENNMNLVMFMLHCSSKH